MADFVCFFCGKTFSRYPSKIKGHTFCSVECNRNFRKNNGTRKGKKNSEYQKQVVRNRMLSEKNPMFGKKETEEHKRMRAEKIKGHRGAWTGKKQPREMIEKRIKSYLLGHKTSKETRRKLSLSNRGKKRTREQREQNSIRTSELFIKRGFFSTGVRGKWGYFYSHKNKENMFFRSSFEEKAYKILEGDKRVIRFFREPIRIPYFYDGLTRNYIPDIMVVEKDCKKLIEVKANWEKQTPKNMAKMKAAIEFCQKTGMKYEMWTEDFLNGRI